MIKKHFFKLFIYILVVSLVILPELSQAHGAGASWEKVVGEYKVDVGYNPTAIVSGASQRLDFNILNSGSGEQVSFANVWVRISQGEQTVFASGIKKPGFGTAGMVFTFPKQGDYILSVRFENSTQSIAEAEFPVSVAEGSVQPAADSQPIAGQPKSAVAGLIGLAVGVITTLIFARRSKQ
jgi:hypothetical protein